MSGPEETRGQLCFFEKVPFGVTILTLINMSSILPYTFFFIPEARVETHPPAVENSRESGIMPVQTPCGLSFLSKSCPLIPACTQHSIFSLSTHRIFCISPISTETIILVSEVSHSSASVTFVPPP